MRFEVFGSYCTTLTVLKYRRLVIWSSVWTVSCEGGVRSNYSAGQTDSPSAGRTWLSWGSKALAVNLHYTLRSNFGRLRKFLYGTGKQDHTIFSFFHSWTQMRPLTITTRWIKQIERTQIHFHHFATKQVRFSGRISFVNKRSGLPESKKCQGTEKIVII